MSNFEDQDDDLFDEPTSKIKLTTKLTILVVAFALLGCAWYFYSSYKEKNDNEMLLITVEPEEIKVQPIEPGGMVVENMDKAVYEAIEKKPQSEPKVEVVLQPSEEPIDKKEIVEIKPEEDQTIAQSVSHKETESQIPAEEAKPAEIANKTEDWDFEEDYIKPVVKESKVKPKFADKKTKFYKVQLAAFKTNKEAEKQWQFLLKKHNNLFKSYKHFILSKNIPGKGLFYRLHVGDFETSSEAKAACKSFKDAGVNCFVVKPEN